MALALASAVLVAACGGTDVEFKGGLFDILFLDNGAGFIALDTAAVVASLDALLVLGTSGYPAGHGKIEKFNQTALHAVLRQAARSSRRNS